MTMWPGTITAGFRTVEGLPAVNLALRGIAGNRATGLWYLKRLMTRVFPLFPGLFSSLGFIQMSEGKISS